MSDARTRAELENTQASIRRLKQELAAWPTISEDRKALRAANAELETQTAILAQKIEAERVREVALRDDRDRSSDKKAWWKSDLAPVMAGVAVIGGFVFANWMLKSFDWYYWSIHGGPWLLAAAPAVNLLRWARARVRRYRRSVRLGATRSPS